MGKRSAFLLVVAFAFAALPAIAAATHSDGSSPSSQDFVTGSALFDIVDAHVVVAAHSGPSGEDPHGHFSLDQGVGDLEFWARVTCLKVVGNLAVIGGETVKSKSGVPAGTGFLQYVQDNGEPGDLDASHTVPSAQVPTTCPAPTPGVFVRDRGNYVVHDATP